MSHVLVSLNELLCLHRLDKKNIIKEIKEAHEVKLFAQN